jgi:RNA polymerase sigma factor (sigma-70 family)
MTDVPDARLLEQFTRNGSEEAFAALVQRHIGLVHSVALRHVANPQHAEDITQAVFIIVARKAGSLGRKTVLPGWLYQTARLAAANWQRAEARRVRRELEAFMQSTLEEPVTDTLWQEMRPQLDEAMAVLGAGERDALVLRYFQNKSMAEVGQSLGLAENTAQKRVGRALEKLRKFFAKRGVNSTAAGIADTISTHSVQVVPATLAKSVTAAALAKGATASTSTLTLIKGALKIMAWTKAKTAIVVGVVDLLATGTTTVTVKIHDSRMYSWRVPKFDLVNSDVLWKAPRQVRILPTKFSKFGGAVCDDTDTPANATCMGICASAKTIVEYAYLSFPPRVLFSAEIPKGNYDFTANLPHDSMKALQAEVKKRFGLIGKRGTRETDGWRIKPCSMERRNGDG